MKKQISICLFLLSKIILLAQEENGDDLELFLQRRRDQEINKLLMNELKKEDSLEEEKSILKQSENKTFYIKKIELVGENLPKINKVNKFLKENSKKYMGLAEIQNLTKTLTNIYISKGYVGARVLIPTDQNLMSGELKLIVILGKIEAIKYNDNSKMDRLKVWLSFPKDKDNYLKLSNIERGINNINLAPQNNATMNILPGEEFGGSIVEIKNNRKSIFHGINLGYNNFGSKSTGKNKMNFSYDLGDVVGLNEVFSFYGNTNVFDDYNKKKDCNFGVELNVPFRSWNFGVSYNESKSSNTIQGNLQEIKFKNQTNLLSYKIGKIFYEYPQGKLRWDGSLNIKDKKSYVNNEKITVSSRKTKNLRNTLSLSGRAFKGAYYLSLSYQKGLESSFSESNYNKYNTYLKVIKPFVINNQIFTYEFSNSTQYTKNYLYSDEKYSLGNELTVRGYKNSVSGDNGYLFKNQIYYTLPEKLSNFRVYCGVDNGKVYDRGSKAEYLVGGALGLEYTNTNLSFDLSVGKALRKLHEKQEKPIVYFSVNTYF